MSTASSRKFWKILLMVLVLGILAALMAWMQNRPDRSPTVPERPATTLRVQTQRIDPQDLQVWRELNVQVQPLEQVVIRPQVSGQLQAIHFQEGQWVKKGQLLAELDTSVVQAQQQAAVAETERLKAALAQAQLEQRRYAQLLDIQAVSRQEADQAQSTAHQLAAQLRAAQAQGAATQATREQRQIRAPFAGRLGLKQVSVGAQVGPNDVQGLVTLTQLQPIAVDFGWPEALLDQGSVQGRTVELRALQSDQILARGQIDRVGSQIDAQTASLPVRMIVPNRDQTLYAGQSLKARVLARELRQVMAVPVAAVQQDPEGAFLWTLQQGRTLKTRIQVQTQLDEQAVVQGLPVGAELVVSGFGRLKAGQKVQTQDKNKKIQPLASAASSGDRPTVAGAAS